MDRSRLVRVRVLGSGARSGTWAGTTGVEGLISNIGGQRIGVQAEAALLGVVMCVCEKLSSMGEKSKVAVWVATWLGRGCRARQGALSSGSMGVWTASWSNRGLLSRGVCKEAVWGSIEGWVHAGSYGGQCGDEGLCTRGCRGCIWAEVEGLNKGCLLSWCACVLGHCAIAMPIRVGELGVKGLQMGRDQKEGQGQRYCGQKFGVQLGVVLMLEGNSDLVFVWVQSGGLCVFRVSPVESNE